MLTYLPYDTYTYPCCAAVTLICRGPPVKLPSNSLCSNEYNRSLTALTPTWRHLHMNTTAAIASF